MPNGTPIPAGATVGTPGQVNAAGGQGAGIPIPTGATIGAQAQPDTGIWAGVKRNTVGMVAGLYHAFTDPATDEEKQDLLSKVREQNADGDNIPEGLATNPSRATLAYHRLIDAPADVLAKKGKDEQAAAKDLLSQGQAWKGANLYTSGLTDRGLAAVPMAGPWLNSVAERYENGDVSGAATDVAAAVGFSRAPEIAKAAKTGIGAAREGLQDVAYKEYPTNGPQLTKGANRVGRAAGTLAGGGIGAATGVPGAGYAGGVAGFELGPTLMEKVLGTPEIGDVRNPGPFGKLPWRMKAQAAPAPVETSPFKGMTSSSTPGGQNLNLPFLPKGEPAPFPVVRKAGAAPQKSLIQDPNSPPPNVRVTYQSVPQPELLKKVMGGDRDAITEWQRRGLELPENVGFMTESGAGTLPWRRYKR